MSVFDRMNEQQKREYLEIQNEHLALFATDFRNPMNNILYAARSLESDLLGETELSRDEKAKLINTVIDAAKLYFEFIERSLIERKAFLHSVTEQDDDA